MGRFLGYGFCVKTKREGEGRKRGKEKKKSGFNESYELNVLRGDTFINCEGRGGVGGTELTFGLSGLSSAPLCDVQMRYSRHGSWGGRQVGGVGGGGYLYRVTIDEETELTIINVQIIEGSV